MPAAIAILTGGKSHVTYQYYSNTVGWYHSYLRPLL